MGKIVKNTIAFLMGFVIILSYLTRVVIPEYFTDTDWPVTVSRRGFYKLENNTVDVLFLGSSAGTTSFIPQELYNNYGITSYNLSCEQQSLLTTYYWLMEALNTQSPKAVVLEPKLLFSSNSGVGTKINSSEGCTRKAIDSLKWSFSKIKAIKDICRIDQEQSLLGYFFPIVRYHSRWSELTRKDFLAYYFAMRNRYELKGYDPFDEKNRNESWIPYRLGDSAQYDEEFPGMGEYLNKIISLCNEKGIMLMLVYTPSTEATIERHNVLQSYADKNGLILIDFNEFDTYDKSGFMFIEDGNGGSHSNLWGAKKLTNYIGDLLRNEYHISGKRDVQWEETRQAYKDIQEDFALRKTTNIDEYLSLLCANRNRYDILIAVRDDATRGLKGSTINLLKKLGLNINLKSNYRASFLAALLPDRGGTAEEIGYEELNMSGTISRLNYQYFMKSGGYEHGNTSSIMINGIEYSKNRRGLNFVVFDENRMKVIDQVSFDTCAEDNTAYR